jgi:polysaccharide biosynthesis transport protein
MNWSNGPEDLSETAMPAELSAPVSSSIGDEHSAYPTSPDKDLQFRSLMIILRRRIGLILAITALGTTLAAAVALLIHPKYTAKAQVIVDTQQSGGVSGHVTGATAADELTIDTYMSALASNEHLRRVLDSLARDPGDGAMVKVGKHGAQPCAEPPVENSAPSGTAEKPECPTPINAKVPNLEDIERYLRVSQERASRVISISFTATNPNWAATVANRVVQVYIDAQTEQKRENVIAELERGGQRLSDLKAEGEQTAAELARLVQLSLRLPPGSPERRDIDAQLRQLEHGSVARDQLYASLFQRQKELRYQQEMVAPDLSVLSSATPPIRPSSPSALLLVLPAFILSLMAGCFLAVVLDRLDQGLRSEQEVAEVLGISTLAMTPLLSRAGRTRMHKHFAKKPFDVYTEAIRSVVAGLQLVSTHPRSKIVLMSSSLPREGKTTLAVSIAMYMAQLRKRVLLVDLDFRRGAVMRVLNIKCKRGITDVLLHDLPPQDVIQKTPYFGLDYLPMSGYQVDPMHLFTGSQLSRLLNQLRESYDCLIVDGPPVLGVTEARLLATLADQLVFVVKWGSTRWDVALNAINQLRKIGCLGQDTGKSLRAVICQVDLRKHAQYRYGDVGEYHSEFRSYYSSTARYRTNATSIRRLSHVSGGERSESKVKVTQT